MDAGKLELMFFDLLRDFSYFASVVVLLTFECCKFVKDDFERSLDFNWLFLFETMILPPFSSLIS